METEELATAGAVGQMETSMVRIRESLAAKFCRPKL
jgi:hypothetical protein